MIKVTNIGVNNFLDYVRSKEYYIIFTMSCVLFCFFLFFSCTQFQVVVIGFPILQLSTPRIVSDSNSDVIGTQRSFFD